MKPKITVRQTVSGRPMYACSLKGTKTRHFWTAWGAYMLWKRQSKQLDMFYGVEG